MSNSSVKLELALELIDAGKLTTADSLCKEVSAAEPENHSAIYLQGIIAYQSGNVEEALTKLNEAERLAPKDLSLKRTLASLLLSTGDFVGAAKRFRALAKRKNLTESDAVPLSQLGEGFRQNGNLDGAFEWFRYSLELQPENKLALTGLFVCGQLSCDWQGLEELEQAVEAVTQSLLESGKVPVEDPFIHLTRSTNSVENLKVARAWSEALDANGARSNGCNGLRDVPIRLGYLSSDLHEHATAYLIHRLFELHDRDKFEVFAYSCGPNDGSPIRDRLERDCDQFRNIEGWDANRAVTCIMEDQIQILIDLKGHTRKNRLDIAARRPAPIQITYLGFPGSSGAPFFDYLVADRIVLPEKDWQYFSEKPILMPHCYQINSHQTVHKTISRLDSGLPASGFVFCSFTNTYKIEPIMFERWMNILKATPGSVLWLCVNNALAERNLRREAEARDIASERLIFAPFVAQDEHLARLSLADLALDTRVYNGHTTTSDALWAGVPVLTVRGRHFASRVSESILSAAGLSELVASDLDAFQAQAIEVAADVGKIKRLKEKVAEARQSSPLFDTKSFVRHFECGLAEVWRKAIVDLPLEALLVEDK